MANLQPREKMCNAEYQLHRTDKCTGRDLRPGVEFAEYALWQPADTTRGSLSSSATRGGFAALATLHFHTRLRISRTYRSSVLPYPLSALSMTRFWVS